MWTAPPSWPWPSWPTASVCPPAAEPIVTLCSNPSTGYAWSDPVIDDASVLTPTGMTMQPAASPIPEELPGTQSFSFRGGTTGRTMVAFSYDQPWEGGETGAWTLHMDVTVEGPVPATVAIDCSAFEASPHQAARAEVALGATHGDALFQRVHRIHVDRSGRVRPGRPVVGLRGTGHP